MTVLPRSGSASSQRVLVVGAGISGLVAARELGATSDVHLVEAQTTIGGRIRTVEFRGRPLDVGADSFITRNPAAEELCRELGIGDELIAPASASAAVYIAGKLHRFPSGLAVGIPTDLGALWRSKVVPRRAVVRAAADLIPRRAVAPRSLGRGDPDGPDPSIAAVVRPRLGAGVFDALVAPLLGGINAGDVDQLSFEAAVPDLAKAVAGRHRLMAALRPFAPRSAPTRSRPVFFGLERGLSTLIAALEAECSARGVRIDRGVAVERLLRVDKAGWRARIDGHELDYDGAVVAVPAPTASSIVASASRELSTELDDIPYAGVVTVTLAWPKAALASRGGAELEGSGVLVADDAMLTTALTFVSTKWPRSANPEEIVVRASAGRFGDERALGLDDDELTDAVRSEVAEIVGIDAPPLGVHVERFSRSFPQYVVGHRRRVARIDALADELGAVALTGSWARGLGIPACIAEAKRAAARVLATLAR